MSDKVQVTLDRDDWDRILRLVHGVVPVAAQSVEDAYEWDEDEGPDQAWIEARERSAREARQLSERVSAAVQDGTSAT
jgi:hypothetical protein